MDWLLRLRMSGSAFRDEGPWRAFLSLHQAPGAQPVL